VITFVFENSSHSVSSRAAAFGELAVTRQRDLGARIAALGDMALDRAAQPVERRSIEAEFG
jgi:hypothetical protein